LRDIGDKKELEMEVTKRNDALKESNVELQKTISDLKLTQDRLIESEKISSLGNLVAGVAHEINTPIGIGLTGITHFLDITKNIKKDYAQDNISEEEFENYLETSNEIAKLININLQKTAQLVKSFKQISVDQASEDIRVFNVNEYVEEILLSLHNVIKKTKLKVELLIDNDLNIKSYPGTFSQVITNLIINSIRHGYAANDKGKITIEILNNANRLKLIYTDDGKGISNKNLSKIFDPFFTTNREKGGTGLGLNIIHNLITTKLNGTITCKSKEAHGVEFTINITV
jgi:signal transduction histidine kinase